MFPLLNWLKKVLHLFVQNTFEPHCECNIIKIQPFHLRHWKEDGKVGKRQEIGFRVRWVEEWASPFASSPGVCFPSSMMWLRVV